MLRIPITDAFDAYFHKPRQEESLRAWWKDNLYIGEFGTIQQKRLGFFMETTSMSQYTLGPIIAMLDRLETEYQISAVGTIGTNQNALFQIKGWRYWTCGKLTKKQIKKLKQSNSFGMKETLYRFNDKGIYVPEGI
jgi:hypothetical protein